LENFSKYLLNRIFSLKNAPSSSNSVSKETRIKHSVRRLKNSACHPFNGDVHSFRRVVCSGSDLRPDAIHQVKPNFGRSCIGFGNIAQAKRFFRKRGCVLQRYRLPDRLGIVLPDGNSLQPLNGLGRMDGGKIGDGHDSLLRFDRCSSSGPPPVVLLYESANRLLGGILKNFRNFLKIAMKLYHADSIQPVIFVFHLHFFSVRYPRQRLFWKTDRSFRIL